MVESANGGLKGGFVNIQRKFLRVMGLTKVTLMLAFAIAGYNVDRIRSFISATKATLTRDGASTRGRAKRRRGTWANLLDVDPSASGPDPPPG